MKRIYGNFGREKKVTVFIKQMKKNNKGNERIKQLKLTAMT